jgi:hypothetical protein
MSAANLTTRIQRAVDSFAVVPADRERLLEQVAAAVGVSAAEVAPHAELVLQAARARLAKIAAATKSFRDSIDSTRGDVAHAGAAKLPHGPWSLSGPRAEGAHTIDVRAVAKLVPGDAADEAEWARFEAGLRELRDALNDERNTTIVDLEGHTHTRASYTTRLERDLRRSWVDPAKAAVVAKAASEHFAELGPERAAAIEALVTRYIHFIGIRTDNAQRIFAGQELVQSDPAAAQRVDAFLRDVSERMTEVRGASDGGGASRDTIAIITQAGGGAHTAIAATIEAALRGKAPTRQINLSATGTRDGLERTLGFSYATAYNRFFQQAGRPKALELADEVNQLLFDFLPGEHYEYLRRQAGDARVVVSTTHWPDDVALVAEQDKRILIQVADYGEIHESLRDLAHTVAKYDLDGIEFLLPADESLPAVAAGKRPFVVRDYPVEPEWSARADLVGYGELRARYDLAPDAAVVTVLAGAQGASQAVLHNVEEIVDAYARDLGAGRKVPPLDVLVVAGHNEALRGALTRAVHLAQERAVEAHALGPAGARQLRADLRVRSAGFVPNADLARLVQLSAAVLSKPGGRTTAELLASGTPSPLVVTVEGHTWEANNVRELQRRLGAEIAGEARPVGDAVMDRVYRVPTMIAQPSHGSVAEHILDAWQRARSQ